jgi:methionine-rich copper-binding protein CopC
MKRLFVLVFAIAVAGTPAMAHAFLQKANPAAGDNLKASPAKVELHFTESLEPAFSGITVTDADGHDMGAGAAVASGAEMDLPLKPLAPGRYRVTWHAVSVDTHRTDGKYNFLVLP